MAQFSKNGAPFEPNSTGENALQPISWKFYRLEDVDMFLKYV